MTTDTVWKRKWLIVCLLVFVICSIFHLHTGFQVSKMHVLSPQEAIESPEKIVRQIPPVHRKAMYLDRPLLHWQPKGRIGNLIFEFTSAFCTAVRSNHTPTILSRSPLLQLFNISQVVKVSKQQKDQTRPSIRETECCFIQPHILEQARSLRGEVSLYGYLHSYRYMLPCWDQLSRQLQLSDKIQGLAQHHMVHALLDHYNTPPKSNTTDNSAVLQVLHRGQLPRKMYTMIGVHIRRTDRPATYPPKEFFRKAFRYFENKFGHVIFFACSDDIKWAKGNLPSLIGNSSAIMFMSDKTGNAMIDFGVLINCDHSIITAGTFSWWSGWLTQGEVIYHTGFHYWKKTNHPESYKREDFFPENWLPMD